MDLRRTAKDRYQAIIDHGLFDRLSQISVKPNLFHPQGIPAHSARCKQHKQCFRQIGARLYGQGQRFSIHIGHHLVDDGQVKAVLQVVGLMHQLQRLRGIGGGAVPAPPIAKIGSQHLEVGGIIINDENALVLDVGRQRNGLVFRQPLTLEYSGEPERRPFALRALNMDTPTHHLRKLFRDGQP